MGNEKYAAQAISTWEPISSAQGDEVSKLTKRRRNNLKRENGATLKSKQYKLGMREAARMCEGLVGKIYTDWHSDDVLLHVVAAIREKAK